MVRSGIGQICEAGDGLRISRRHCDGKPVAGKHDGIGHQDAEAGQIGGGRLVCGQDHVERGALPDLGDQDLASCHRQLDGGIAEGGGELVGGLRH